MNRPFLMMIWIFNGFISFYLFIRIIEKKDASAILFVIALLSVMVLNAAISAQIFSRKPHRKGIRGYIEMLISRLTVITPFLYGGILFFLLIERNILIAMILALAAASFSYLIFRRLNWK